MKKRYFLYFFLFSLLLRLPLAYSPSLTESVYSRGVFVAYRYLWDYSFGWSPLPLVYVFGGLGLGYLLYNIIRGFFIKKETETPNRWLLHTVGRIAATIGFIIAYFLFFWGYNYCRTPLETQLHLNVTDSLTLPVLRTEAKRIVIACQSIRDSIPLAGKKALKNKLDFDSLEVETRNNLEAVLEQLHFPTGGAVRGRLLYPKGILLRNNTAGVYLPWVGEGHLDAGLPQLQIPFTLAHEMSHGYGFTDEGVCNFLAYLACERSRNPFIKYSGRLSLWRYVFSALHKKNTPAYLWERAKIQRGMHEDLKFIRRTMEQYPDILKGVQASTYDSYLKIQGVKEGLDSYERMVALVLAWNEQQDSLRTAVRK
jgi:Protein of unknown function (DUF3810)